MEEEGDTLTLLLAQIGAAFAPLGEALESTENFELYARELGWSVNAIPRALQDLAGPLSNLAGELASGDLDASSAGDFINLLRAVVDAIDAIRTAPAANLPPLPGFAAEFPQQVLDRTIIDYLMSTFPSLGALLHLAGIFQIEPVAAAAGRLAYTHRQVNWAAIADLFQDPFATLDAAYSWGTAFAAGRFIANLRALLDRFGIFVRSGGLPDDLALSLFGAVPEGGVAALVAQLVGDRYTSQGVQAGLYIAPTPDSPGLVVLPYANGVVGARLDITEELALTIQGETVFHGGFAILLHPGEEIRFLAPVSGGAATSLNAAAILGFEVDSGTAERRLLFGSPDGSRFEFTSAAARAGGQFGTGQTPVAMVEVSLQGGRIVIDVSQGDGFLAQILPQDGLTMDLDLTVGFNSASGIYFGGSSGLEIELPAHISLGPVEIHSALLALKLKNGAFVFEMGATVSGDLSVLKATVENIGLSAELRFVSDGKGNAGPADLSFAFKPPNGVGLSIDAGVVKGGGYLFLDFDKGEYAGALELTVSDWLSLKAIGLINTLLPGGQPGFSLLVIITAEFSPGLQLGFGFTLIGVGGLLGLNRAMLLDPLVQGVRTGSVDSVLFPTDIIANAPKIISDLQAIFPPQEGIFLIGPMAKIGWGTPTLISVALGVIIEIPGDVVILGKLLLALPTEEEAVLVLQVSFVGALEFDKQRIWFFASMYDSRVLFITLEGEMGLLMDFGDAANFVLSVGGFHPRFTAPPLPFPSPARIRLSIINESWARLQAETYFAVTSNTVQIGARADAFFGFDALSVEGYFSFDALLRFSPFYFIIEISTGFSVKVFGVGVWGVHLRGSLEGPTPWHIKGSAEIEVLFFSISVDVDETFGESRAETLPPIAVLPQLKAEYEKLESWQATLPETAQLYVSLRTLGEEGVLVLHPVGTLRISQRFAPLNLSLDKIGNQKPSDVKKASVSTTTGSLAVKGSTKEQFASAQYVEMDDAAKLSAPAFEPMDSGVELAASGQPWEVGPLAQRNVRYETIIVDNAFRNFRLHFFKFWDRLFTHFRAGASVARAAPSLTNEKKLQPFDSRISVTGEQYTVAFQSDNTSFAGDATFGSYAEAQSYMSEVLSQDPLLYEEVHVIPFAEVNRG